MLSTYLSIAAITAVVAFVVADGWAVDRPVASALIAGLLWPLLLVGLVQFLLVAATNVVLRAMRSRALREARVVASTGV